MTEKEKDLVYEVAARVRALADMRMPVLRKVVEPDVTCRTRGEIVEWAIINEFIPEEP